MPVSRIVQRRYGAVPEDVMRGAVADAVLHVLMSPHMHMEARSNPVDYILRISNRRLQDKLRTERRRMPIPIHKSGDNYKVPHSPSPKNDHSIPTQKEEPEFLGIQALPEEYQEVITSLFPDKQDQEFLELIMSDEYTRDRAVVILGVADLPPKEQQTVVRRNRSRILGRLRKGRTPKKEQS